MTMVTRIGSTAFVVLVGVATPADAQNTTTRISVTPSGVQGNNRSFGASLSDDGRYITFVSDATNLVPGDTNNQPDIFVRDRQLEIFERVNLGVGGEQALGGPSNVPSISANGRFVQFSSSASNLIGIDTNDQPDIFVHDRQTNLTTRVSVANGGTQAVGGASFSGVMTPDARYVAFSSNATNLVTGDTNSRTDVFLHDRQTGTTQRVSLTNGGVQATGGDASSPSLSANGRVVAFSSQAIDLVTGDTNARSDVFVRDLQAGTTSRISLGPGGVQGNDESFSPSISGDGRFVVFASRATTLVPNGSPGIYVHDRTTGATSALSLSTAATQALFLPRISRDGRYVCFSFDESTTTPNQLFVLDRQSLAKTRVDLSSTGVGNNVDSNGCAINGDGTLVAFDTTKPLVLGDTNAESDVYLRTVFSTMALDKTALTFGALTSGATFVSQTAPQSVRLVQSGAGTVTWTATPNQPWLQVSPASGTGSATLSISVVPAAGLPPSGAATGLISVTLTGALNALAPITVTLRLTPNGTALGPFGTVDTPTDNRTGVTGALPFTGWALDDVEVTRVSICRAASDVEVAPIDPNCGGAAEIFVGFAVFIDGARPDVAATFPTAPLFTRAGWGFMVLTNMLPGQGNGTYRFTMRAQDREGNWAVLGTRTMTCANASATLPFGTLDTPEQGGLASGPAFPSFGWALTPLPKRIPINGLTIRVLVDGVDVGPADYNHFRPDIQALFPGLNNSNAAVGFRILDTTAMTNGLHTIEWVVTDDQGAREGLGSRFFAVSNGAGAVTAAASATSASDVDRAALDTTPLAGRRGWDLEAPFGLFGAGANGITVVRSEEVNRVELQLGDGDITGYLRTFAGLAPLPIGSRLDPATNIFTWAPGVGFVGRYDFVFVQSAHGRAVSRREVRIVLHPKGSGSVGPQVVIDVPSSNAAVREPFMVAGWAVDLGAAEGTGVTTLHAWAYPTAGGAPIFLGATAYGGARPDVAAVHGDRFKPSGFGLTVHGLPAGDYDLALFAWSSESVGFVAPATVRVRVTP
jgi:Tol biopolymer transport system component